MSNEQTTSADVRYFKDEQSAKAAADVKNRAPLPEGTEKRNPFKVYKATVGGQAKGFVIGQTPTAALSSAVEHLGIVLDRVDHDNLPPLTEYLSKLSPAEREQAKKLLAGGK